MKTHLENCVSFHARSLENVHPNSGETPSHILRDAGRHHKHQLTRGAGIAKRFP